MPKKVLEFVIPEPIGYEKVGNLEIPLYGFVFQSEEAIWEAAYIALERHANDGNAGDAPNVTLTNKLASAILAERVDPDWTPEEVAKKIPWNFTSRIYKILANERFYEYEAKKKEEEAAALKEMETANTSESSSLPTGDESDTN